MYQHVCRYCFIQVEKGITCGSIGSVTVFSEMRDGDGDVGLGSADPLKGVPPALMVLAPEPDPRLP